MRKMLLRGTAALSLASLGSPALAAEAITYAYDAKGRLVRVVHSGAVNNGVTVTYAYDKADNRQTVTTTP